MKLLVVVCWLVISLAEFLLSIARRLTLKKKAPENVFTFSRAISDRGTTSILFGPHGPNLTYQPQVGLREL
ncbi:hypothetical protein AAW28_04785 [Lacticaseibacillus casei]|nr:hypothetical protein AAW28_04785 [Lacticaseibacillus casei]